MGNKMHIYHIKRTSEKRTTSLVAIPVYKDAINMMKSQKC